MNQPDDETIESNTEDLITYADLREFLEKKIKSSSRMNKFHYIHLLAILDLSACSVNNHGNLNTDDIESSLYSELS